MQHGDQRGLHGALARRTGLGRAVGFGLRFGGVAGVGRKLRGAVTVRAKSVACITQQKGEWLMQLGCAQRLVPSRWPARGS